MKTAFRITAFLAAVSAAALLLQVFGFLTFSISNLTFFASGLCGSGILLVAIADYAPRRRIRLGRTARRTLRRENAAPNHAPHSATTWGYQTISA